MALFLKAPRESLAVKNPLTTPNNPYGIHIFDENDLTDAQALVNSNGGDWGYVTLVIRKDERDTKRWQSVFNKMRRLHLIPIVRIATKQLENGWEKPNFDEIEGWVSFLKDLNWVIQNRYVIIGNEPNHAPEWGGEVNPSEYADYLYTFSKKLKASNPDFFVMPAGFDASVPNGKQSMSEDTFLRAMIEKNQNVFDYVDGWASHSYPNPNFSGSQDDTGRGTVRTYKWELNFLEGLGITKKLPVFITETGWAHNKDEKKREFENIEEVTDRLKASYELAWKDERVVAITPFILNYQNDPFDVFSWKKADGTFYEFYYEIQKLPKPRGVPKQVMSVDVLSLVLPPLLPSSEGFVGIVTLKNKGQSIWKGNEKIYASNSGFEVLLEPRILFSDIEPGEKTLAVIKVKYKKINK